VADDEMTPRVVVVGGGYGGTAVAKALDGDCQVVLIDPKDAFEHNVASLRAMVDPSWTSRMYLDYHALLERGRFVRGLAERIEPSRVVLESGEEIPADVVVIATGSSYPFPGKSGVADSSEAADRFHAAHEALAAATRVLLVGAGPVGIELAGEIAAAWPAKQVTIVDLADEIFAGSYRPELRAEVHRQLEAAGARLVLGSPIRGEMPTPAGVVGEFTVTTDAGVSITADLWFRCFGVTPRSEGLAGGLESARTPEGFIAVAPTAGSNNRCDGTVVGGGDAGSAVVVGGAGRD
jgi:NADH dehydrogenase FAD-containing subunit